MDSVVKQAMAKWPNVPHCYGWLGLDRRGNWRMRDERTQAEGTLGDRIVHEALRGFIERNYAVDERGCWFFQNGPQRVYVVLERTPYIAQIEPGFNVVLNDGRAFDSIDHAWLTTSGELVLTGGGIVAAVDDRDVAAFVERLRDGDQIINDESLLKWLSKSTDVSPLSLELGTHRVPVNRIEQSELAIRFGFVCNPVEPKNEDRNRAK